MVNIENTRDNAHTRMDRRAFLGLAAGAAMGSLVLPGHVRMRQHGQEGEHRAETATATFYVSSTGGENGNNHDGSLDRPWKTISYALSNAGAGSTIVVRGGVYSEQVVIRRDNITLRAHDRESPIIDGKWDRKTPPDYRRPETLATKLYDAMLKVSANHVTVDGLEFKNLPARCVTAGIPRQRAKGIILRNISLSDSFGEGIIVFECDGALVENCLMDGVSQQLLFVGKTMPDGQAITNGPHSVGSVNSRRTTFHGCTIQNSFGEGFNGYRGFDTTIEKCKVINNAKVSFYLNWSPGAVIRDCESYQTKDFRLPPTRKNLPSSLILADEYEVEEKGRPHFGRTANVQIYNNVFVNGNPCFAVATEKNRACNMDNIYVAHNTVVSTGSHDGRALKVDAKSSSAKYPRQWKDSVFENNIFYGETRFVPESTPGIVWRHNLLSQQTGRPYLQGNNNIVADPRLSNADWPDTIADYSTKNYFLTSASPAIDAGRASPVVATDIQGSGRGSNKAPDIGFHEYGGKPAEKPTKGPTMEPTAEPTQEPNVKPTKEPTVEPVDEIYLPLLFSAGG